MLHDLEKEGTKYGLVVADPPWHFGNAPGKGINAEDSNYECMEDLDVVGVLIDAYRIVEDGRMAMWISWAKVGDIFATMHKLDFPWRFVSGGAWSKEGGSVMGFHWRGASEPVFVFVRGKGLITNRLNLENNYKSYKEGHSKKPAAWMADWILEWTNPGDTVIDLFAGCGNLAVACAWTGRRYIGCEIDADRHSMAINNIMYKMQRPPRKYDQQPNIGL